MQAVCDYGVWVIGMGATFRREGREDKHGTRRLRVLQGSGWNPTVSQDSRKAAG